VTPITQNNYTPSCTVQERFVADSDVNKFEEFNNMHERRQTKIKIKIKSKEQPIDYDKMIQREIAEQDFEFPEIMFEPVAFHGTSGKKLTTRQKKIRKS
jgi:hypothetical protein